MKTIFFLGITLISVLGLEIVPAPAAATQTNSAQEFTGLWQATLRFGPDVRGSLLVDKSNGEWRAEIAGRSAVVNVAGETVSFELPDGTGAFLGKFDARRTNIVGHWIQPTTVVSGARYASPVTLMKDKQNVWRGEVWPLDDSITFYLSVKPRDDGSVGAFLKNPERNLGRFIRVDHIEREGNAVKLFAANSNGQKGRVLAEGKYDGEQQVLSLYFPNGGGTFDFKRVAASEASDFYPRGRPGAAYSYAPPPALNDGWQTASLEDVGISRVELQKFIQLLIDTPIDSVGAPEIHGVLIARHGKLVLEEYFHGENRDKPHDTRSAAKSMTSTLFGAAVRAGVPVAVTSPVYQVMNDGAFPPDLEPKKKSADRRALINDVFRSGL